MLPPANRRHLSLLCFGTLLLGCSDLPPGVGVTPTIPGAPVDDSNPPEMTMPTTTEEPVDVCLDFATPDPMRTQARRANLEIALPPQMTEVSTLRDAEGHAVGATFFDPGSRVAGFVVARPAALRDLDQEAHAVHQEITALGVLSGERDRLMMTWNGSHALSTVGSIEVAGASSVDLTGDLAERIAGAGALSGRLPGGSDRQERFAISMSTFLRSSTDAVVALAIAPEPVTGESLILLADLTNGTSFGEAGDRVEPACDDHTTAAGSDLIDFLWVVDNSASMGEEQAAVADVGEQMVSLLSTTQLSWRLALTTTDRLDGSITASGVPGFTPSSPAPVAASASRAWAEAVGTLGTDGSGEEQGLESGIAAIEAALPASPDEDPTRLREGASVMVVHMSDEEDFSVKVASGGEDLYCPETAGKVARIDDFVRRYQELGQDRSIAGLRAYAIHSIRANAVGADYCDYLQGSGDCQDSQFGHAYVHTAAGTGGGAGSICGDMGEIVQEIVRTGAGIASQVELSEPPVSFTIEVVVADEDGSFEGQPIVPRSRENGFDHAFTFDPSRSLMRHKVVFYGDARPPPERALELRYRAWRHGETTECGDPCGPGEQCLDGICVPDPPADPCDGACGPTQYCDPSTDPPTCRELV